MELTNTLILAAAIVIALLVGGFVGVTLGRRQRTKRLQEKFGPEYEHTLNELGDQRQAEKELAARLEHVKALQINPLSREQIEDFTIQWQETQADFVDDPLAATQRADGLIREVMQARGYPVEDFEQQVADISVDYPDLVMDYRGLHLIAVKGRGEIVPTEEMRKAMLHGRALFENLIEDAEPIEELELKETEQVE